MTNNDESTHQLQRTVHEALFKVLDPEIGESIIDLGLVYGINVEEKNVTIDLTMTSAACPMGDMLLDDIDAKLAKFVPSDVAIEINLVWEPAWNPDMISAEAKSRLGWV